MHEDDGETSWQQWKLAYTEICDKHAPMKSLRLRKKRSNLWITHDIIKFMYQHDNVHAKAIQNNNSLRSYFSASPWHAHYHCKKN